MRPNPLLHALERGSVAVGGWLLAPSPLTAEFAAHTGFDYCCIDMQHGLIGYPDAVAMLQAFGAAETTAVVRVPWNEPGIIGKVLDAGAMAIIVPMVNTAEQAAQAVARAMYPPLGSRSSGPLRAMLIEGPDYPDHANAHVQVLPMIETTEAIDNLDAILATEGVDTIYVGPMDLGVSMGLGRGTTDPAFFETLDHIVERCAAHDVVPGIHANPTNVTEMIDRGFRVVTVQTDVGALRSGLAAALETGASGRNPTTHDSAGY